MDRKEEMKKIFTLVLCVIFVGFFAACGCAKQESNQAAAPSAPAAAEKAAAEVKPAAAIAAQAVPDSELVSLTITAAEASSFDTTPDWAPEPNAMAVADGDMLSRWSSNYEEGDQWITLDLGQERTVSQLVITWERAYATDYKILVSSDGAAWQEVFNKINGKGGTEEVNFAPVKCRYIKILGTKRVNEDWGISIWEIQVYGPAGSNPDVTMTKEAQLNKSKDSAKDKEAEDRLAALSSPIPPLAERPFQKGLVYTSWMADELGTPASDLTLAKLKEMGFDTVAIMVPAYQDTINSEVVFTNDHPGGDTPTDTALKHAIESCHKLGMRVLLKPHVDPRTNEARINIMASEKWFDSFEAFTLRYAKMAEETGCEIFAIGTELEATTFSAWTARWNQVIDKVREVYKGKLTYAANWTEYAEVPFWDNLDMVGIDAYFPVAESNNPTVDEITAAWTAKADEIEKWLQEKGLTEKGVIFTEIGYPSADGAARQPWVAITAIEDQQEQADSLQAMFSVLTQRPWFKGYYLWQYFPQERWSPLGFTVNGKQAEKVIEDWLKK